MAEQQSISSVSVNGEERTFEDAIARQRAQAAIDLATGTTGVIKPDQPDEEWIYHRNTYRGKNLGSTFTQEQKAAIKNGTFDDLYVGDYWENDGHKWVIADINYWKNNTETLGENHIVVVPSKSLYYRAAEPSGSATKGVINSDLYTNGLTSAKNMIQSFFGSSNMYEHNVIYVTSINTGQYASVIGQNSVIDVMNQIMVFGSWVNIPISTNSTRSYMDTYDTKQLALFALNPNAICSTDDQYWLRDLYYAGDALGSVVKGQAHVQDIKSTTYGVRPVFGIKG